MYTKLGAGLKVIQHKLFIQRIETISYEVCHHMLQILIK